tara:strand:- start:536 stop:2077 length:1542 start_codon:yes stop_codon:yes gene_type:complete
MADEKDLIQEGKNDGVSFFGFEIRRKKNDKPLRPSFVPKTEEDGAGIITTGGHFGAYLDVDGDKAKSEIDLIFKYRDIATQPECDAAVEDIVNESIVGDNESAPIAIVLDELEESDKIKESIRHEFDVVTRLLNFNQYAHDIFRKWYVDGRLPYHIIIDKEQPKAGIKELRYIDPTKLRKVKEVEEDTDPETGAKVVKKIDEYFMYQDNAMGKYNQGVKIYSDAIAYCTSGVMDPQRKRILSYLQKAVKPVNQLRMMEDSLVIYRISRAPERRIFYIDVGNLPKGKAEEYLKGIMNQYRNKLVYDAKSGEVKDDKKHMSMLEDFFLPRREGGRGTEISTLSGGENLGQIDDILYFQKKLYKSLNVPVNRLEQEAQFSLGRSSEITRDEVKFKKFIDRLRKRFSDLFMQLLKTQLLLKGVIGADDWKTMKEKITFDFIEDNYFSELKESEMIRERFEMLNTLDEYIGTYVSNSWVRKHILRFNEDDIEQMQKEIDAEKKQGDTFDPDPDDPRFG